MTPKTTTKKLQSRAPKKTFSVLERNILMSKGVSEVQLEKIVKNGIRGREDFRAVGDAATLAVLADLPPDTAARVMAWALGLENIVVESADLVRCMYCGTKQPKDYKSGDLCVSCGKQAEPIMACFWCGSTGPGKFCRRCGAEFVPTGELELAILLKRDGLPKGDIPEKLRGMSQADKDVLWGRARRY
ncbi:MAG: hypothetical protein LAP13_10055 [Acidobacteriia bacterium]|nr:hypothetical protein [Terriglobia bacterium]